MYLLYTRSILSSSHILTYSYQSSPRKQVLLPSPFYKWGNQGTESLINLSKVTSGSAGLEPRQSGSRMCAKDTSTLYNLSVQQVAKWIGSFLDINEAWNHKHIIAHLPLKTLPSLSLHSPVGRGFYPLIVECVQ